MVRSEMWKSPPYGLLRAHSYHIIKREGRLKNLEDNNVHLRVQNYGGTTELSIPADAELGSGAQNLLGWFKQTASELLEVGQDEAELQHWQRPQDRLAADDPDGEDS